MQRVQLRSTIALILILVLFDYNANAGDRHETTTPTLPGAATQNTSVGIGINVDTRSSASAFAGGGDAAAKSSSVSAGGSAQGGTINQNVKYPNQAPPTYIVGAPSSSNRGCQVVGGGSGSGPLGGLSILFPMGGETCDGLNTADKLAEWAQTTGVKKLFHVECELMVLANDDLEEAFEKAGYSCNDAYTDYLANLKSQAKMQALYRERGLN